MSTSTGPPDDGALLARVAARDTAAFAQLYDRHAPAAFGYALRVLADPPAAEEAVLEAFLSLWRQAARVDPGRATARVWLLALVHQSARPRTGAAR